MSPITQTGQQPALDSGIASTVDWANDLPDHTQLPDKNGEFVKNYQEPPQGDLLTDCITPILDKLHPDGNYCIGRDSGIYWRLPDPPEAPEKGAEAPDWCYIPNVPATLDGKIRRSYVLWKEPIIPLIALEFVSGNGEEERDTTPIKGKFWVYERAIQIPFYGIYEVSKSRVEVYRLVNGRYQKMQPNDRGHYSIEPLNVELGIWQGRYQNQEWPWLRWWDSEGKLLLTSQERIEQEQQRANRLAEQLRALGVEPEG
ncbi:Uma2 family endonuclease [Roseofilum casamattae]|uniref:Uma2 family endonuclease n=1 Tax=Roseofilum casamattae BLCC-M143 TaxID=3022442 RepID=A0ABT7BXD3_9CYAN|nr:Uma2 family endonuclease [Roseofilum casamattae]MDJ1183840.1 Uma2 family endonuclease [Roseofilum casamattae BLCC-M143]